MDRPYRYLVVHRRDDVCCVRLRKYQFYETELVELEQELTDLIEQQGCRKLALRLGPDVLDCLYSVFMAKLVLIQRRVSECGGVLKLYDVPPAVAGVFEACRLKDVFDFLPDEEAAVAALRSLPGPPTATT